MTRYEYTHENTGCTLTITPPAPPPATSIHAVLTITAQNGDEVASEEIGELIDWMEDCNEEDQDWSDMLEEHADQLVQDYAEDELRRVYPMASVNGQRAGDHEGEQDMRLSVSLNEESYANTGPLTWCNSARIYVDPDEDSVTVAISCGDPRGAFTMQLRKLPDGRLVMHLPHENAGMLHRQLKALHEGTYEVQ